MTPSITPYSSPNSLDAMHARQSRSPFDLPAPLFRTAEILACLQTLDDDMAVASDRSSRRRYAAESWRELAGDIVSALPIRWVKFIEKENGPWMDPFAVVKRDFPPSDNPHPLRTNLPLVLQHMVHAARHCVGTHQRYTDNYHGVICVQLRHHGLITAGQCITFHRDIIGLPMPEVCKKTGLVYRPDYEPDHLPRGSADHFDLSEYEGQTYR